MFFLGYPGISLVNDKSLIDLNGFSIRILIYKFTCRIFFMPIRSLHALTYNSTSCPRELVHLCLLLGLKTNSGVGVPLSLLLNKTILILTLHRYCYPVPYLDPHVAPGEF